MNPFLKVAGILVGSALVATTVINLSKNIPLLVQSETVQETPKFTLPSQIQKPALIQATGGGAIEEAVVEKPEVKKIVTPPKTQVRPVSNCHPSYSGCLEMNAGDYDCDSGSGNGPNYTGSIEVYGSDPFDLDRDNDGWGCE